MTKEIRTQWHPAFCSAIKLEFKEDKQYLEYYEEYNLNTKPLQIDLLVIKKAVEIELKNEIGKIFRGHNIIEYKSPEDALDVNTFLKTIAYACLYKTKEHYMDAIHLDDITLTFIRKGYPRKLIKWFRKNGYIVTKEFEGVFYVRGINCFPIQIVVTKWVSKKSQKWLTLLNDNLGVYDARRAIGEINKLTEKDDKDCADSVLQVVLVKNRESFDIVRREEGEMCEALRELMKDEIEEELRKARTKGLEEGRDTGIKIGIAEGRVEGRVEGRAEGRAEGRVEGRAESLRFVVFNALELGKTADEIVHFTGLSEEEVEGFVKEWKNK